MNDTEDNRFSARAARYVRVGASVGRVAARVAGDRLSGREGDPTALARQLGTALGGLKGPLMKVAQLLSTIPEALPPEYARELSQLQSAAPAMGPAFVKRRMCAELGPDWRSRFRDFETAASASASLGQVHRAVHHDGRPLACKLQYPDMASAVEADLTQLGLVFAIHARLDPAVETAGILTEIGARLREELDYKLEAAHAKLYGAIFAGTPSDGQPAIRVPEIIADLSTGRLLTMSWLEGRRLLDYTGHPLAERNAIAAALFRAWWHPFSHFGVIHGDPHLGNYTVFEAARPGEASTARGINLLDYGCIRTFPVRFVQGVIDLYHGLRDGRPDLVAHAYETWGFRDLSPELIEALTIWARFIYGPLIDDRERTIAEGTSPGEYGRREAFSVHKILREKGPVAVPREFVFMDRAAIGLGGVFLHLDAKLNWCRLFSETIESFDAAVVAERQADAFGRAGVPLPQ